MTQPSAIVHARGTAMLKSALGPAIAAWLDEPGVAEVMLNADGRLWVDRLDSGMARTEERLSPMQWLKTLRKKNASVVFATQSLADIEGSAIAPAIIESCPTRLFLANERALEPQIAGIYRRFGLNDRQIEIIASATPKRDYYCQSALGNRLFDLGLGPVALAFAAASQRSDLTAISALIERHGAEGFAAAWLRHRGLGWAADYLINDALEPQETYA